MNVADLTDPATLAGKSDQELLEIINRGKGKMPGERLCLLTPIPRRDCTGSEVQFGIQQIRSSILPSVRRGISHHKPRNGSVQFRR
jgi:hypothetical protein